MNILNLPNWLILKQEETEHDYKLTVKYNVWPRRCPHCATVSPNVIKHGTTPQTIIDLPVHAKRVALLVQRQRYLCKECQETFFEEIPDIADDHLMTNRLLNYIQNESLKSTFVSVGETTGVAEGTVRRIFKQYTKSLDQEYEVITPTWLGLDEIYLVRQYRAVIANVKEQTILDLLTNRKKPTVAKYIAKMKDRKKVELVTIDMWPTYRDIALELLPQADIVIDKFHAVKMANEALERVRRKTREDLTPNQRRQLKDDRFILLRRQADLRPDQQFILETWTKNFPLLGKAYELKEEFFGIWDKAKTSKEAGKLYLEWREKIPLQAEPAFQPIITAMVTWQKYIFAYFDHDPPITNAFTESMNNLIKLTNRVGRGYSFEAIRAKVLYNGGLRKHPKRPIRSKTRFSIKEERESYEPSWPAYPESSSLHAAILRDYGTSIPTLVEWLERNEFSPDPDANTNVRDIIES